MGSCVVFNIGGNKCRMITRINYEYQRVYTLHVLSHAEYDNGAWKHDCTVIEKKDLISEFGGAPKVITSDAQHVRYVSTLLELERRESGGQLNTAERAFAELLTLLVDKYEEEHRAIPSAPPREVLRELVESNNLRQKDLTPEFGAESIVSEVLNGKRELNKDQIERLSRRFHVSPAVFFQVSAAPGTKLSFRVASDDKRVFTHRKTRAATKRRSRSHRNRRPGK